MEPIWAAIVAGIAVLLLAGDFWWDKRKDDKRTRAAIVRGIAVRDANEENAYYGGAIDAANPVDINSAYPLLMPEKYRDNIENPLSVGSEPQAYYRPHHDVYILPLRSYEWETVRYALNTMPPKSMHIGDKNVIVRRMENVEK